ncbi:sensor histidine kinase [Mesorhizobium sp. ZMM04-5]|uniref:histidine kinase n=1 Tax=Mesorhizobium marinum TaxID=3228790 RepID=A0ABV3QWF9_9HYPH
MRRTSQLRRSTPFRLALAFAVLLIGSLLLSGLVVYQIMSSEISDRVDEELQRTTALLSAGYDQNDPGTLVAAVQDHADLAHDGEQLFGLWDQQGTPVAGSMRLSSPVVPGLATKSGRELGQSGDDAYRVLFSAVGAYSLGVAIDYAETDELRTLVLSGFAWATLFASVLAIAGGGFIASRVQRRLDAIGATMNAVSQGLVGARIPLLGNDDDIDALSTQVNAALDRITVLMEGLRQVGYDIAHDLRTPLNRIRIALERASSHASSSELAAGLREATVELESATQTFDALLRIAQIEAGAKRARFQMVDLADVLRDVHDAYAEVAIDAGKTLSLGQAANSPVSGDRDLLVQMCANLVENALTHTPPGTKIAMQCATNGRTARLRFSDNGPGIPAAERSRVFQRLYRMDKSRSTPGNGLGLSMVKAIADLHHATIALEDARPGLDVVVDFPLVSRAEPYQSV